MKDLPDVQELIAEVNAEKYSLQAAAILGRFQRAVAAIVYTRCNALCCCPAQPNVNMQVLQSETGNVAQFS